MWNFWHASCWLLILVNKPKKEVLRHQDWEAAKKLAACPDCEQLSFIRSWFLLWGGGGRGRTSVKERQGSKLKATDLCGSDLHSQPAFIISCSAMLYRRFMLLYIRDRVCVTFTL